MVVEFVFKWRGGFGFFLDPAEVRSLRPRQSAVIPEERATFVDKNVPIFTEGAYTILLTVENGQKENNRDLIEVPIIAQERCGPNKPPTWPVFEPSWLQLPRRNGPTPGFGSSPTMCFS